MTEGRRPGLDLLRVIACGLVVVFHLHSDLLVDFGPLNPIVNGGNTGVYVFFALSGFLLYRPFLRGPVDTTAYGISRIARIVPGYLVALVCLALITRNPLPAAHPFAYLSMTASYNMELRGFLGVAWTLSAELIFYALLPLLARFLVRAPIPKLSILALVSVVATAIYGYVDQTGIEWLIGAFPFVFWAFVPGMLLAVIEARDPATFDRLSRPWVAVVGGSAILVQTLLRGLPVDLAAAIGTPLVIAWLSNLRLPSTRLWTFVGGATYAMYLWHKDLFLTFGLVGLPVALVGAALSWAFVEHPVLALAHRITARMRETGPKRPGIEAAPS